MDKLRDVIQEKGIMKKWLAEQLGISPTLLTLWLKGERTPSREHIKKIASVLEVCVDDIIDKESAI